MKVVMKHETGVIKTVKVGFSWTLFFFGWLVPAVRGTWSEFFKIWLLAVPTLFIYPLIQCFTGNRKYIQFLAERGYRPATDRDRAELAKRHIIA